jgi:DNA-binding Lrp family transcriptional regulator
MNDSLDNVNIKLLGPLGENSKISTKDLAVKGNFSPWPVFERLKKT